MISSSVNRLNKKKNQKFDRISWVISLGLGIITRSSLLRMQHTKFEAEKYVMTKENWSKAATEKRIKKQPKLNWKLNSLAFTCSQQSASATAKSLRIFHWKFFFPLCIMNMWSNKRQTEIGAIYRISFICELIHWIVEVCECLEKSISAFIVTFYSMHFFPFIIAIIILRLEQQIHRNISFSFVLFCSFFVLFGFFVHFFRSSYIFLFSRTYYFSFAQFFSLFLFDILFSVWALMHVGECVSYDILILLTSKKIETNEKKGEEHKQEGDKTNWEWGIANVQIVYVYNTRWSKSQIGIEECKRQKKIKHKIKSKKMMIRSKRKNSTQPRKKDIEAITSFSFI